MKKISSKQINEIWEKVEEAETYHKTVFADKAERMMALMRGDTSYMPKKFEYDIINPNLIFSTLRTYIPNLYPANLEVHVKPRGPEFGEPKKDNVFSAAMMQQGLNYYQQDLEMKKTDKAAILGALGHGISYVMDAWCFETNSLNPQIVKDQPIHKFVSGVELIPDPDGLEFEDKSFVVRTFGKRISEMERLKYKNLDGKEDSKYNYNEKDKITKQPIVPKFYEIWDKNTERVIVMSKSGGAGVAHQEREFKIVDGFPFTPLAMNPMVDNFYPLSLIEVLEQMQKFITLLTSYGARHVKMSTPKYAYFAEYMDAAAKRAFKSGEVLDAIPLRRRGDEKVGVHEIIQAIQTPNLPQDFYNMFNISKQFLNTISGVSEQARGGAAPGDQTATSASILDSYLRGRTGDYKELVDDFVTASRRKMIKIIRDNATEERFLRFNRSDIEKEYYFKNEAFQGAVQKKGNYVFVPWRKEDISGEYDLVIGVGAGLPNNEEFTYKRALNNFNIMANDQVFDPIAVRKHFLEEIGVPNPDKFLKPPAPPPSPEKPKVGINISVKAENLPPDIQSQILQDSGVIPAPSPIPGGMPQQGMGGETPTAGPRDAGLQRELGIPGLQSPPRLPE